MFRIDLYGDIIIYLCPLIRHFVTPSPRGRRLLHGQPNTISFVCDYDTDNDEVFRRMANVCLLCLTLQRLCKRAVCNISGLFIKVYSAKKYDFSAPKKIIRIDFILSPPPSSKLLEEGYGEERFS